MGLTIHYELAATCDETNARKLVQQLRQAALELPFQHVGEIVEFRGDQFDWEQRPDDDPFRWLLIQAGTNIALPVSPSEKRQGATRLLDVRPLHMIAFETEPGEGCEPANFGLCRFPSEISQPQFGKLQTKPKGCSWYSFCKRTTRATRAAAACPISCAAIWAWLRSWTRPRDSAFWAR